MSNSELEKLLGILQTLHGSHRNDLIIDTALKVLAIDPQNFLATYELSVGYNNSQNYDKLLEATTVALSKWPDRDIFYEFEYLYYLYKGGLDYLKARDAMLKAITIRPTYAPWYRHLGEIYLINREPEKAEKYLAQAVKLSPENPEFKSRLALARIRLGKVEESINMVLSCLRDAPDNQHVLDNAGMVYILSGEIDKAEELFCDALKRYPTYNYFQSHLDWVLKEKCDKQNRLKNGQIYTPLYIRQKDRKRFFDEEAK